MPNTIVYISIIYLKTMRRFCSIPDRISGNGEAAVSS